MDYGTTRRNTILIAATHRSGSYLACDWLSQLGGIPFAEEYFNFELLAARQELRLSDDLPRLEVLERMIAHQRATAGIFAVKAMWPAFESLFTKMAAKLTMPVVDPLAWAMEILGDVQVLFVRRRDKAKQAVSFEKAKQQAVWRSEKRDACLDATLVYNYPRILDCWKQIHQDEAAWLAFLNERHIPYFEIWYEDMVQDPMGVIGGALRSLGIEPNESVTLRSQYQKLSGGINAEWLERFLRRHVGALPMADQANSVLGAPLLRRECAPSVPLVNVRCLNAGPIQMPPDSAYVVNCELSNQGYGEWLPAISPVGEANYWVELRGEAEGFSGKQAVLWRTELEELPGPGEVASVPLRLGPSMVFDDFYCHLFFGYPGGEFECGKRIQVKIKLDEKWDFLRRVFGELSTSEMSSWVRVPALGDIWTDSFPFIYQREHGWLYVDTVNSSPGIFCSTDFELAYFALHLNAPSIYFVWIDQEPQRLEFLGTRDGRREFRNPETGQKLTFALSARPKS